METCRHASDIVCSLFSIVVMVVFMCFFKVQTW